MIYGIDVSEHNGKLDWAQIKASGIKFAIIRTGYGKSYTDPQFHNNMKGAIAQGLPVGIYHFSYALDVAGAKREAEFVLSLIKQYKDKITLPVFFDFEYDTIDYAKRQGVTLGKQAFNDHTVAFCEVVEAAGYRGGTYYNLDYKNRFVDMNRLKKYVQWYAQYSSKADWTGYDIWQYSSKHKIAGHSCNFDVNVADDKFLDNAPKDETKDEAQEKDATENDQTEKKGEYDMAKLYKNGATSETVYADTKKAKKVGFLNPYEACECIGEAGGMFIVKYKVDGTYTYKVGFVAYHGGLK